MTNRKVWEDCTLRLLCLDRWRSDEECCACRVDLTPLNTGSGSMGSEVTARKVLEDVLSDTCAWTGGSLMRNAVSAGWI